MTAERDIQAAVLLALGARPGVRLFRNNVGLGWQGQLVRRDARTLTLADPRPLHAGLHKGSGDLVGWQSVVITPDMVGQRVAVLVSLECKAARGRATEEQVRWAQVVREAGGLSGIVRSVDEAEGVLIRSRRSQ